MLSILNKGLKKVFGTKSDKDIKKILPIVESINAEFAKLNGLTNDGLRDKTDQLRSIIQDKLSITEGQIAAIKKELAENPEMVINVKEEKFEAIDALIKQQDIDLEEILNEILPQAFAIVKETAKRFVENEFLEVTANDYDRQLAANREHIEIDGDHAKWHKKWIAAGTETEWGMVHYDVQLIGGITLHQGKIAEMATGEGKTLVATLPAFLNGLSGKGVHVVTVNDYLAKRDSEWMAPIFQFHGLSVDCIDFHTPNSPERKAAYKCDITYGTNNEFGFDYLRDNGAFDPEELVQGKHHFAMIDEVDSILVDEARTPLIISGPIPKGDDHEFDALKGRVAKLVDAQKKLCSEFLNTAKKEIKAGNLKDGGLALFRTFRGMPKYKPLIKFLSEPGVRQVMTKTENIYLAENKKLMPEADAPLYFTLDEKTNSVELTDNGINLITGEGDDPNFFILTDIGAGIAQLEKTVEDETERLKKKDELIADYSIKAKRIHSVNQLLRAYTMFEKDTEYIVVDGKIKIVDEQTGRVMDGRRYSDGLHQALEAKENVKIEDATQTYATITLQNYFRMYHKLSGMTGTAETEAGEFWEIYKLDVVVIPTNRPIQRDDRDDKVYKTIREKFKAVAEEIVELSNAGRPILVGTTSVEISELLSRMLKMQNIKHNVLNAKQHSREAEVVAEAGQPGTVTIATNMAGRGTDIKLSPESKAAGGLAIIGTERHDSRRVDRQLRGRAGRQGDPGSSQFYVSLEDNLMRMFMSDRVTKVMDRMGLQEGEVIQHPLVTKSIERAQKKVEENNFGSRKRLLEYDDVMNSQREVIYKRRRNALFGDRLDLDILNMLWDTSEMIVEHSKGADDYDGFKLEALSNLGIDADISKETFIGTQNNVLTNTLYKQALKQYRTKNEQIRQGAVPIFNQINDERGATLQRVQVPFTDGRRQIAVVTNLQENIADDCKTLIKSMEKMITLAIIDNNWKEHLREMDDLKTAVQNAYHEQKDPLIVYKFEGFEAFQRFINKVDSESTSLLTKCHIYAEDPSNVREAQARRRQKTVEKKAESRSALSGGENELAAQSRQPVEKTKPRTSSKAFGRNDRITVVYQDGTRKENVKYKTVERDVLDNKCVVIEN